MKGTRRGEEGLTVVAVLVYLIIAAAAYLAFLYAPIGLRYYEIREAVGHAANMGHTMPDESYLRLKCADFIKKGAGLTIRPEECEIRHDRKGTKVIGSYTYVETVRFIPSDHQETYKFDITVESESR